MRRLHAYKIQQGDMYDIEQEVNNHTSFEMHYMRYMQVVFIGCKKKEKRSMLLRCNGKLAYEKTIHAKCYDHPPPKPLLLGSTRPGLPR